MTEIGIKNVLDRITQQIIPLPDEPMTARDLEMWLRGYSAAQTSIKQMILEQNNTR